MRISTRILLLLSGATLALVGLVACGGKGGSTDPNPVTPPNVLNPTQVSTVAGLKGVMSYVDGPADTATFKSLAAIVRDSQGNLFVADELAHSIRKITPAGVVSTFAGKSGETGSIDGTGSSARFYNPCGLAIDASDNLFVAEYSNNTIRKITPSGVVSTYAGSATAGGGATDGQGSAARFYGPCGIALDGAGNLYVADSFNRKIRKIAPAGVVTTFAGTGSGGSTDGSVTTATFEKPFGVVVDGNGTLYVTDFSTHVIRKISGGTVTTLAGTHGSKDVVDGQGAAASFSNPTMPCLDDAGNLYVGDYYGNTIRKVTPTGQVTTFAGKAKTPGYTTGALAGAQFSNIYAVYVRNGRVYITDRGNSVVQLLQ